MQPRNKDERGIIKCESITQGRIGIYAAAIRDKKFYEQLLNATKENLRPVLNNLRFLKAT